MKPLCWAFGIVACVLALSSTPLYAADFLGDALKKGLPQFPGSGGAPTGQTAGKGLDDSTIVSGLKEALSIGTKNAVSSRFQDSTATSATKPSRSSCRIRFRRRRSCLGKMGYQKQVDEFILSMNHAAEKAAPKAASYFGEAIKGMSIEDARKILSGGNTAATEYFKSKTSAKLYDEFKPSVSESMNQVGVTHSYNAMMEQGPGRALRQAGVGRSQPLCHHEGLRRPLLHGGTGGAEDQDQPRRANNGPFEEGIRQIGRRGARHLSWNCCPIRKWPG